MLNKNARILSIAELLGGFICGDFGVKSLHFISIMAQIASVEVNQRLLLSE